MTKGPRDSIAASFHLEPYDRQASHDVEGVGSQEDAEGSSLKKARSFMATLVSALCFSYCYNTEIQRLAIYAAPRRRDVTRTDRNVATAEPTTWSVLTKHRELPRKTSPWPLLSMLFEGLKQRSKTSPRPSTLQESRLRRHYRHYPQHQWSSIIHHAPSSPNLAQ